MLSARPKIRLRKRIIFSFLVVLGFFGALELSFRGLEVFDPPRHVDYGLGFNEDSRLFVPSWRRAGQMETQRSKRISFVQQSFDRIKSDRTFRIVALGGSSVNYLQPEFSVLASELSAQFRSELDRVEIINCGGEAYGSHRLVLVFREILDYDPDLILLYSGHNEFEEVEQLQLSRLNQLSFDRTISKSAFIRFLRELRTDYEISRIEKQHNQRVLDSLEPVSEFNYARAWSYEFSQHDVDERMEKYEHNLRLISTLAHEQNIPIVVGSVASNLFRPYLPRQAASRYEQVYELWNQGKVTEGMTLARRILIETPGRHQCSDLENDILRRLADEFSLPLVDVESLVTQNEPQGIPGETLFDDHCHLNAAGREVWITGFAPVVRNMISDQIRHD